MNGKKEPSPVIRPAATPPVKSDTDHLKALIGKRVWVQLIMPEGVHTPSGFGGILEWVEKYCVGVDKRIVFKSAVAYIEAV